MERPSDRLAKSLTQTIVPLAGEDPPPRRIQTFIRVRPPCSTDTSNSFPVLTLTPTTLRCTPSTPALSNQIDCSFDLIFPPQATQEAVFESVQALLQAVRQGHNATIVTYGQTGTGKTHTMLGSMQESPSPATSRPGDDGRWVMLDSWGLMPRTLNHLLESCNFTNQPLSCAYVEIYNDKAFDLMADKKRQRPLALRERLDGATDLPGLTTHAITSVDDAMRFLHRGRQVRAVRETDLNATSSRSHVILQIKVGAATKLNLVDLAGSEKWTKNTRAGAESEEIKHINTSLSALGNCVAALTQPGRKHIPYRDSTLTRLLQDSLGGTTRTVIIATVHAFATDETIRTIQFADRMRAVMQSTMRQNHQLPLSCSMQWHKDLAATRATVTELAQKLEDLTSAYENQSAASRRAMESMADAVYQKLLQDEHHIQKLHEKVEDRAISTPEKSTSTANAITVGCEHSSWKVANPTVDTLCDVESTATPHSTCIEVCVMVLYVMGVGVVIVLLFAGCDQVIHAIPVDRTVQVVAQSLWPVLGVLWLCSWLWTLSVLYCGKWMVVVTTLTNVAAVLAVGVWITIMWKAPAATTTASTWVPLTCATLTFVWLMGHYIYSRVQYAFTNTYVIVGLRALRTRPWTVLALWTSLSGAVIVVGYMYAIAASVAIVQFTDTSHGVLKWGVVGCLGFQFLWTVLIVRNTALVVVASLFRPWWHHKEKIPLCKVSCHVLTQELHVICLGSLAWLLILPVATVWLGLRFVRRSFSCHHFGSRWDSWLACVSTYAWVTIDTTQCNVPFFETNRHAHYIFRSKGWTDIANDLQINTTVSCHAFGCGLIGAGVAWYLTHNLRQLNLPATTNVWTMVVSSSILIGVAVGYTGLTIAQAVVATVVVEFAKDPNYLAYHHAIDHQHLHDAWNAMYPHELAAHERISKVLRI